MLDVEEGGPIFSKTNLTERGTILLDQMTELGQGGERHDFQT